MRATWTAWWVGIVRTCECYPCGTSRSRNPWDGWEGGEALESTKFSCDGVYHVGLVLRRTPLTVNQMICLCFYHPEVAPGASWFLVFVFGDISGALVWCSFRFFSCSFLRLSLVFFWSLFLFLFGCHCRRASRSVFSKLVLVCCFSIFLFVFVLHFLGFFPLWWFSCFVLGRALLQSHFMPQGDIQDEGPCFFFPFDPCLFWWPEVFRFDVAKPRADRSSFMFGTRDFPGNMIGSLPNMILDSPRMPGLKWKFLVIVLVYSCVEFGTSQYMITSESIPPRLQLSFVFIPNFGKDFEWFWFWRASFNKGCLKPPR